jgi:hypothetical protein
MPSFKVRGLIQISACLARILFLTWILMPGSAVAWNTFTHPYLSRIAFDQMPTDFRDLFTEHVTLILSGSLAPDLVLMDWSNHEWNVHSGEGGQGRAPARVEALFATILEGLTGQAPDYPKLANELGLLAHYMADINQPLHTDKADHEGLAHVGYEWDVYQRQDQFRFLDHGRRYFLDPYSETVLMAEAANRYYDQIMESYVSGIGYEGLERITALQLQNAVNAITDAWTTVWLRAMASGPSVGIRTNQAFFGSGERVEIVLSTLAGNAPTPGADIYVAVADQWGGLWFIGPEGMSEWPPVPWCSGVTLSDEKSIVLAFELGEIREESCYGLYAVAVPTGQDPLEPQWWLSDLAGARFCLTLP